MVMMGKRDPYRAAVSSERGGPGRPLTPSQHVGAHDEKPFGVDGRPRPDDPGHHPPLGARAPPVLRVGVHAQRMEDEHGIALVAVSSPQVS